MDSFKEGMNYGYAKATSDICNHILTIINAETDFEEDMGFKSTMDNVLTIRSIESYVKMLMNKNTSNKNFKSIHRP